MRIPGKVCNLVTRMQLTGTTGTPGHYREKAVASTDARQSLLQMASTDARQSLLQIHLLTRLGN